VVLANLGLDGFLRAGQRKPRARVNCYSRIWKAILLQARKWQTET